MQEYQSLIAVLSMTMGAAWASGINLYAALLVLGIAGATGNVELPQQLQVLQDPMVIAAAGLMYFIEFFADKIPGVDSAWDTLHTFVRIPAGALLAAGAIGDVTPAVAIAAGILGGGMAATSHATKAGLRLAANTSPEPLTNWALSIGEDVAVVAGLWMALAHPWLFLAALGLFILLVAWLLPKIWRAIARMLATIRSWLARTRPGATAPDDGTDRLLQLKDLLDRGLISDDEFQQRRRRLVDQGGPGS